MSRADTFVNPIREDWMTDELIGKIRICAQEGGITCAAAQQFARDNSLAMNRISPLLNYVGLKVKSCQLGCF